MFDCQLPDAETLGSADDAAVVTAIAEYARVEAAAAARRLAMQSAMLGPVAARVVNLHVSAAHPCR
jgi:hypothetical protein